MPSGYKSILLNSVFLGTARILTSSSRAIYAIALASFLGAENYGSYNYGLSWYLAFFPLSILGMNWVLAREIGTNPSRATEIIGHTFFLRSAAAAFLSGCSMGLAFLLETDPELLALLLVFSLALFFRSLALWFQSVFVAREDASRVLMLETVFRLAEILIGIWLLWKGFGLIAIAINHVAVWVAQDVFSYFLLRNTVGSFLHRPDPGELRRLFLLGLPFMVAALFGGWLLQGSLILYRYLEGTSDQMGHLALALQAFVILSMIAGELGNAALPVLARSIERGDGKSGIYVQEVLRLGWFLGGALAVGGLALGPPLIRWILGEDYLPVADLLAGSLAIVTFYFWMSSLQGMVGVHGHFGRVILGNVLGAAVFTGSFLLIVPSAGEAGVLMALGSGLFTVALSHILALGRHHELRWIRRFFLPALSVASGFACSRALLPFGSATALIGGLATMAIVALLTGAVRPGELRHALAALRALR